MRELKVFRFNASLFIFLSIAFSLAFSRIYLRVQTTLIGYELGKLKSLEAQYLEEKSHLQMDLAKLTTKDHLNYLASSKDQDPRSSSSLAVNH